jgi:hypothetical protein
MTDLLMILTAIAVFSLLAGVVVYGAHAVASDEGHPE